MSIRVHQWFKKSFICLACLCVICGSAGFDLPYSSSTPTEYSREAYGREDYPGLQWSLNMLLSYKSLHGALPSDINDELFIRLSPGGYLHNTFGPSGQNKATCDFLLVFKFTATFATSTVTKAGDILRWDAEGITIYVQNNYPAHTKAGNGILTVSSTDLWLGVTRFDALTKKLIGQFPDLKNAGFDNITRMDIRNNPVLINQLSLIAKLTTLTRFETYTISGDLSELASLALTYLGCNNQNHYTISGDFVNSGLTTCNLKSSVLSQAEVDRVLADYVNVAGVAGVNLDLNANYTINLGGANAAPSAAGENSIDILRGFAWVGVLTITVTGGY